MYRRSSPSNELDLFANSEQHLSGSALKRLQDENGWHNHFFREITSQIDEDIFAVLYNSATGRPNAPIRVLVGMLILKDGQNWTDEQLFDACQFNLLVRRALGLNNLSDPAPVAATFYNFKAALLDYYKSEGVMLLEKAFAALTGSQVLKYNVDGKCVRMDSKLLNSNVAKSTRLRLCLDVLRKAVGALSPEADNRLQLLWATVDEDFYTRLTGASLSQQIYRLDKPAIADRLLLCGKLIRLTLDAFDEQTMIHRGLLQRLWQDHFELIDNTADTSPPATPKKTEESLCVPMTEQPSEDNLPEDNLPEDNLPEDNLPEATQIVALKDVKGQPGTTLQSAHDTEAAYRNKPGSKHQRITGYVCNITETCASVSEDEHGNKQLPLRLITDVRTEIATHTDDKFLAPALQQTAEVMGDGKVEACLVDGAYNSPSNVDFCRENNIDFNMSAIQGAANRYSYEYDEDNHLIVTDLETGRVQQAKENAKSYRIDNDHNENQKYYYIRHYTIDTFFRRQQIERQSSEMLGLRANAEATVAQVFCHLNGSKTKYRGLFQHKTYALTQCFWTNLQRIKAFAAFLCYLVATSVTPHLGRKGDFYKITRPKAPNLIWLFQRTC